MPPAGPCRAARSAPMPRFALFAAAETWACIVAALTGSAIVGRLENRRHGLAELLSTGGPRHGGRWPGCQRRRTALRSAHLTSRCGLAFTRSCPSPGRTRCPQSALPSTERLYCDCGGGTHEIYRLPGGRGHAWPGQYVGGTRIQRRCAGLARLLWSDGDPCRNKGQRPPFRHLGARCDCRGTGQ